MALSNDCEEPNYEGTQSLYARDVLLDTLYPSSIILTWDYFLE
ncbi:hypothetical protein MiSe_55810 [Microseira wollei NIES-4236]|uniref:Uncharacterized protein n=1 Tax=Microseira wollei NIES-4236 TaxID=2530354 RepID=A0AAV3XIG8_9CYAN|nr:hypothetical protein MiSe_55810 [Microseira wollei NIES-4236]